MINSIIKVFSHTRDLFSGKGSLIHVGMRVVMLVLAASALSSVCAVTQEWLDTFNEGFDDIRDVNAAVLDQAEVVVDDIALKAVPGSGRKMLIYGISAKPHRFVIPTAVAVLEMIGNTTGAYEPVLSLDLADFEPEALAEYDAVCFPCSTGEVFVRPVSKDAFSMLDEATQDEQRANAVRLAQNLADYVNNGGGFIGTHGATDCNKNIPAYIGMIGGRFNGHPWGSKSNVTIRVEDPDHPLIDGIYAPPDFTFTDEIYEFTQFSRDRSRVLLSLDIEQSDAPSKPLKSDDIPVSWLHGEGDGRVFYTSFGHNVGSWDDQQFLEHVLAGAQYALGDLVAPDTVPPRREISLVITGDSELGVDISPADAVVEEVDATFVFSGLNPSVHYLLDIQGAGSG